MQDQLRYKYAYLVVSKYFSYILSSLNEFVADQRSPILINTIIEISLRWYVSGLNIFWHQPDRWFLLILS